MVNHALVAIGINQYQFLQPLRYAQNDARAFQEYLSGKAEVAPQQCWVLGETSPLRDGRSSYPTKANIERSLQELSQTPLEPNDILWCFFSGYGVNILGKDYLMPIDGDPTKLEETGIAMESFLSQLKQVPTENLRVFLDMSRPTGKYAGTGIGSETIELAYKLEITLMLSCGPHQFSREISALNQGLFAVALLEALRHRESSTLEGLDAYMNDRLPELSEHHWRPRQDPLLVVHPQEKLKQPLFPKGEGEIPDEGGHPQREEGTQVPLPHPEPKDPNSVSWERWLWIGGLAILTLLLGVLLSHEFASRQPQPSEESSSVEPLSEETASEETAIAPIPIQNLQQALVLKPESSDSAAKDPATPEKTPTIAEDGGQFDRLPVILNSVPASQFAAAIAAAGEIPPNDPRYSQAREKIERWGQTIAEIARSRAKQENFVDAIAAAQLVSKEEPQLYAQAQRDIEQWTRQHQQQQVNRYRIDRAKTLMQPGQASSCWRAIAFLRQIPPNQPLYKEAQQLIEQWSRDIFSIARDRADLRQFELAIQAAVLVPPDTAVFPETRQAMEGWQQQESDNN